MGEDSMYFDQANNYWVAAVSLGHKGGKRVELRRDMENGVRPSATYTVGAALDDWLANGLSGRFRPDQGALPGHGLNGR
jgi:hypothetical protein